jgi:hypothetical protein
MTGNGSYFELLGKSNEMKLFLREISVERKMSIKYVVDEDVVSYLDLLKAEASTLQRQQTEKIEDFQKKVGFILFLLNKIEIN